MEIRLMGKIPSISFANVNNFRTLRARRRGGKREGEFSQIEKFRLFSSFSLC